MILGAFSVSLSVSDLVTSKEFYEKLGLKSLPEVWTKTI